MPGTTLRAALGLIPRRRPGTLPELELADRGVTVDREHLAAYDRVCGFRLSDRLPATYPHVLAFPLSMRLLTDPAFPFPAIGLVHIANSITLRRPIDAGERLDLSVRPAHLRPHDRGRQFDIVASARTGDETVWESVSTYLSRSGDSGTKNASGDSGTKNASGGGGTKSASDGSGTKGAGKEWEPPAASATWRVPARVGADYAAVSGDRNPIHTSRLGARLFGFPRTIAHGMWSKARCLAALEGRLPDAYTVDVRFKQPILLPATVHFAYAGESFDLFGKRPHLAGKVTPA